MTLDEQKQLDQLRTQLAEVQKTVDDTKARFTAALEKSSCEARLYRALFWVLLAAGVMTAVLNVLEH